MMISITYTQISQYASYIQYQSQGKQEYFMDPIFNPIKNNNNIAQARTQLVRKNLDSIK